MFTIAIAGFVLGPILGLPRLLGKYWAGEYYLAVLGGTFLYVSLLDPSRKKHVTPYVSADDKGAFRRQTISSQTDPLDASSRIRRSDPKIRRREILASAGFVIGPFFLLIIVLALVGPLVEPGTIFAYISIVALIFSAFLILFGGGYLIARTERSLVLESDRKAAEIVERESLLLALKKLGDMHLPDQEPLKKRKNYLIAN